jgi:hypothetical protein
MMEVNLKVKKTEDFNYIVEYSPEFEALNSQQKLDLLQDALYELNKKFKEVNENY